MNWKIDVLSGCTVFGGAGLGFVFGADAYATGSMLTFALMWATWLVVIIGAMAYGAHRRHRYPKAWAKAPDHWEPVNPEDWS